MAIRVDKLEKIRLPPSRDRTESQGPPSFNQTIIINNPNIHINYLNQNQKPNAPLSSRGFDNWNLNNNLKQFSQTRQLGFFKQKKDRNKSNSPYIIHKVRTQDLKSINKIYSNTPSSVLKETLSSFRKNETISHIVQPSTYELKPNNIEPNPLQKIIARHDKTITQKFYHGQLKKELPKNYQTLPTNYINKSNPEIVLPKTFRKNRFEIPKENVPSLTARKTISKESSSSEDSPQKQIRIEEKQVRVDDFEQSQRKVYKQIAPRMVPLEMRKRAFNKTIAKIDQALLSNTDDYFERIHAQKLPQTQIQLLVNSVSHPQQTAGQLTHKAEQGYNWGVYDFEFQQERNKRPKTPKRKKQYDQQDQM